MTCLKDLEVHLAALKHDLEHIQVKFEQEEKQQMTNRKQKKMTQQENTFAFTSLLKLAANE